MLGVEFENLAIPADEHFEVLCLNINVVEQYPYLFGNRFILFSIVVLVADVLFDVVKFGLYFLDLEPHERVY